MYPRPWAKEPATVAEGGRVPGRRAPERVLGRLGPGALAPEQRHLGTPCVLRAVFVSEVGRENLKEKIVHDTIKYWSTEKREEKKTVLLSVRKIASGISRRDRPRRGGQGSGGGRGSVKIEGYIQYLDASLFSRRFL